MLPAKSPKTDLDYLEINMLLFVFSVLFLSGCGVFDYPESHSISLDSTYRIKNPLIIPPRTTPKDSLGIPPNPQNPNQKDTNVITNSFYKTLDNFLQANSYKYDKNILVFIHNKDSLLYTYKEGIYNSEDFLPIASSTKWLTSAVILSLVDDKKLNLDDKIGQYIPIFNQYNKGEITIRQIFSHTSGIVIDSPFDERSDLTLKASVDSIAVFTKPLFSPGQSALYGSSAYKIAARIAEIVDNKPWQIIFEERIAKKCNMNNVVFSPSHPQNPHTGAGVVCSLSEYVKFLYMLNNNGYYNGVKVLSENAINEMGKDQTKNINPFYGLGVWRYQIKDGKASELSSPSAMGVHPWINKEKKYFGIIFTQAGYDKTYDTNLSFRALVQSMVK